MFPLCFAWQHSSMADNTTALVSNKFNISYKEWLNFYTMDMVQTTVVCIICKDETGMSRKICLTTKKASREHGKLMWTSVQPEAALKSTNAFEKGIRYDQTSKRWKDITNMMTVYLAKNMLPINIVKSRVLNELKKYESLSMKSPFHL